MEFYMVKTQKLETSWRTKGAVCPFLSQIAIQKQLSVLFLYVK
ncbi:hypothetical protein C2W63_03344 [Bacillus velezensis]|nr:hypothetical protein C2W63_03344 [Bacillus velezensis]